MPMKPPISKLRAAFDRAKAVKLLASLIFGLMATGAQAAGFRSISVPANGHSPAIVGAIWYPCSLPATKIDLGPTTITGTKDCPISGGKLPLVVISHGNLGAYFDHYDTASALANAGFVVAAINHRGDTIPTLADAADPSVMFERPDDIKRLIDFMLGTSVAAPVIDADRIGFFGFSAGAVTGLVLAGAEFDWPVVLCRFSATSSACTDIMRRKFRALPGAAEPRIKAAVLADPPGMWVAADGLSSVKIPIQLWASERGGRGLPNIDVTPESVAAINKGLPEKHEYHVVANAGHFAFLLCGPSIKAIPAFCADAPGFDRAAFHTQFNAGVVRFFRAQFSNH